MKDRFYLACFRNNVGTSVGFQRLGLVWYVVDIETEAPLTRKQLIKRLAKKYNFHDVGDIYKVRGC